MAQPHREIDADIPVGEMHICDDRVLGAFYRSMNSRLYPPYLGVVAGIRQVLEGNCAPAMMTAVTGTIDVPGIPL